MINQTQQLKRARFALVFAILALVLCCPIPSVLAQSDQDSSRYIDPLAVPPPTYRLGDNVPALPPLKMRRGTSLVPDIGELHPPTKSEPTVTTRQNGLKQTGTRPSSSIRQVNYDETVPGVLRRQSTEDATPLDSPVLGDYGHNPYGQPSLYTPQPSLYNPQASTIIDLSAPKNFRRSSFRRRQDQEDPFGERPNITPGINPPVRSDPIPTVPDPHIDPNPVRPDPNPVTPHFQEIQPRPLPPAGRFPTELPVPPRHIPGERIPEAVNGGRDENVPFVYPSEAVPGAQTYPGPTSVHEPPYRDRQAVPMNAGQTTYGPSDRQRHFVPPVYADQLDPSMYMPVRPGDALPPPKYECNEPCGWRPQVVMGWADPADPCFEPLFYLAFAGSYNVVDELLGRNPEVGEFSSTFEIEDGGGFSVAVGQYQGYNLRTELEYAFRQSDVGDVLLQENTGAGITLNRFDLAGDLKSHSGMANIVWQFTNSPARWVKPYVGAGVGYAFLDANFDRFGNSVFGSGRDGNSTFAYQYFAGINTQLSRTLDVFVEYRYFEADTLTLQTNVASLTGSSGLSLADYEYETHNINFGVRFKF